MAVCPLQEPMKTRAPQLHLEYRFYRALGNAGVCVCFLQYGLHNSSLEGATELKFAPFCSSFHSLSNDMLFGQNRNFTFLAKNHGL